MPLDRVRDLFQEKENQNIITWKNFQLSGGTTSLPPGTTTDIDLRRTFRDARIDEDERTKTKIYLHNLDQTLLRLKSLDINKGEPFEFYTPIDISGIPLKRLPSPGINLLPLKYHLTNPVEASDTLPETGFRMHRLLKYLLKNKYPQYYETAKTYCRPLGTTDANFADFNKEQKYYPLPNPDRKGIILNLVKHFLDAKPYRPMHFCDIRFSKIPSSTGTGYYNRHSYTTRAHAKYARPEDYKEKPTSKGYFMNTSLVKGRTLIHNIKYNKSISSEELLSEEDRFYFVQKFFLEHCTLLFTRNHVSKMIGPWKQRPVYCVDDLFIFMELMLTFPLLIAARRIDCCILYGLETIRGGMQFIDAIGKQYKSYATFDYSGFDQRAPRCLTDLYYTDFLPSLIIINKGYQPTYEYMTNPSATEDKLGHAMNNLLEFLHTWYNNMTFVTQDGFAYTRTSAGVPSGLFNTQYLDSFVNLYMMLDALVDYGFQPDYIIEHFIFLLMGDDNSILCDEPISILEDFSIFFSKYVSNNYGAVVNIDKSSITTLRNKIEILGYTCNFGQPTRNIDKLLAQLCYPEHGTVDKYMSYRALGMAYAAAGSDHTFHMLCEDVYNTFKPYMVELKTEVQEVLSKHVLRFFSITDTFMELISSDSFPSIDEIRKLYSTWKGPLCYTPRWDFSHFVDEPDVTLDNIVTIQDFKIKNDIKTERPKNYFPTEY